MEQAKIDEIKGKLSDGSKFIFYTRDNQQIFKEVDVDNVGFTVVRLLDKPGMLHTYTVTAGADGHEYTTVTLDANLDYVVSMVGGGLGPDEDEYVEKNVPHEEVMWEDPKITFGMFVQAAQNADVFNFDHPEILKILGEVPSEE